MKKIFMIALMAVAAITAKAQTSEAGTVTLTPMIGAAFGYIDSNVSYQDNKIETGSHVGVFGGAELGYQVNSWFKPSIGVAYAGTGYDLDYDYKSLNKSGTLATANLNYLVVPVLANFYVADGLALKIGIQPSFLLSADAKEKVTGNNASAKIKDYTESFDLQIPIGISYEYNNFVIDARANMGTSNLLKKDSSVGLGVLEIDDITNQYFSVTLGYKFELNK